MLSTLGDVQYIGGGGGGGVQYIHEHIKLKFLLLSNHFSLTILNSPAVKKLQTGRHLVVPAVNRLNSRIKRAALK